MKFLLTALVAIACFGMHSVDARTLGIKGQLAPEFGLDSWINGSGYEQSPIKLSDYRGDVVYLFFFQSWCPGCHSRGFPTMKQVYETFRGDKRVCFFAIQTVFEGHLSNTGDKLPGLQREYQLPIPMAHDGGTKATNYRSTVMRSYRSGGTPWTIIIDPSGRVVFNGFRASAQSATVLINRLLH